MSSSRTLSASSSAIPTRLNQPALVPINLSGKEAMNALFDYTVVLMTTEPLIHLSEDIANFNLDDFIGRELTIMIGLDGNGGFVGIKVNSITWERQIYPTHPMASASSHSAKISVRLSAKQRISNLQITKHFGPSATCTIPLKIPGDTL